MRTSSLLTSILLLAPLSAAAQQPDAAEQERRLRAQLAEPRPIAAAESPWIDQLTWMEVRDLIAAGHSTAIIPTGGIEQNGPYLALGKHNYIMEAACPAIARELGNALCAPVVAFVPEGDIEPPTGHMRFAGTIGVRQETYRALLDDIASSLRQHGFTDIILLGDSGGNQRGMAAVASALNERWAGSGARAHFIAEFYNPGYDELERHTAEVLGVEETASDGYHDDILVTAQMMVTDPSSVRHRQRVEAGLASINGVSIADVDQAVALGRRMIEFRAELAADAIRRSIAPR